MNKVRHWWRNRRAERTAAEEGTSLLEMLATLFITALLVAVILPFAAQIADHWQVGLGQAKQEIRLGRASISLQREFASAIPVLLPHSSQNAVVAFEGTENHVQFITPPASNHGLTLQTIAFMLDQEKDKFVLVRRQGPINLENFGAAPHRLGAPVRVISTSRPMHFSFVSRQGHRTSTWMDQSTLPARVELFIPPQPGHAPMPAPMVFVLATS